MNLSYQIITDLISFYGDNNISGRWSVFLTDGLDTTFADENRYITFDASSVLSLKGEMLPLDYKLHQNYPNPFNPITSIKYDLPKESYVIIKIYLVEILKISP